MVPVDEEVRRIVSRLISLRSLAATTHLANSDGFLLPRGGSHNGFCGTLRDTLTAAAQRAGCSSHVTPHRMRHSFATEMVRLGVSLPALMQLLGHKDISMTLRYLEVTLQDLHREFQAARQNATHQHTIPALSTPSSDPSADLSGIRQMLATTHYLLEMYDVNSPMSKPAASCAAWTGGSSRSHHNSIVLPNPKNDDTLARRETGRRVPPPRDITSRERLPDQRMGRLTSMVATVVNPIFFVC